MSGMATSALIHRTLPQAPLAPAGPELPGRASAGGFDAALHAEMEALIGTRGETAALDFFERLELQALQTRIAPQTADEKPVADPVVEESETDTAPQQETLTEKKEEEYSFWDALDVINPLQHIPLVNLVYREITGDEIKPAARIAGGALFGGGIGLVSAIGDTMLEEVTGNTLGGHAMAMLKTDDGEPSPTMLANREKLYKSSPDGPLTSQTATAPDIDESI